MNDQHTRREILRGGLAAASLGVLGMPDWVLPALAQGETVVPFTDFPETFNADAGARPAAPRHPHHRRAFITPKDQFFTTQHYGHPGGRPGHVQAEGLGAGRRPKSLSLDELKKMPKPELIAGFECSGNRGAAAGPVQQRQVDRRAAQGGARDGRRQGRGARVRVLRRRPRRRRSRVAHAEVQARAAVRPQPAARQGAVGRAVPRLRAERRAAHPAPGLPAAPARAGLVRRRQREVAVARSTRRQIPYLGKFQARWYRTAQGRDDRRRDEVEGDRHHPHAARSRSSRASPRTAAATRCSASC